MSKSETTSDDGLHCVYGTCKGIPNGPYPCHPGCRFQMSVVSDLERFARGSERDGEMGAQIPMSDNNTTGPVPWNGPIDKDGNPYLGASVWQGGPPVGASDGGTFIPRPVYHDELAALMRVIARLGARVKELEDAR